MPYHFGLVDDRLVEDTYFLRRRVEPLTVKRDPLLSTPGQAYGSVLRDRQGRWRMYYLAGGTAFDPDRGAERYEYRECVATSGDGLAWEAPPLGLVEVDGSRDNNVTVGSCYHDATGMDLTGRTGPEGFCVLDAETTPVPHARGRFTACYLASPTDRWGGICLAHSDDGLRWSGYPENPLIPGWPDTQPCLLYDPRLARYVLYTRPTAHAGPEGANRKVARAESEDLVHWSVPRVVLDTDERDADAFDAYEETGTQAPRGRNVQYYGLSAFLEDGLYLGLAMRYDVPAGDIGLELVRSYHGVDWRREAERDLLVSDERPAGLRGRMFVPMASPPVEVGDESWVYISATGRSHHDRSPQRVRELRLLALSQKRGRWVGYEADEREGFLLTRAFDWPVTRRLNLNVKVDAGGEVRVGFRDESGQDLRGLGVEEPLPLRGPLDEVRAPVHLATKPPKTTLRMPTRGPVRMHIALQRATLYGWSLG